MTDSLSPAPSQGAGPTFELRSEHGQARGQLRGNQFVVLAGSHARAAEVPSLANHAYNSLRPALIAQGKLQANAAGQLIFTEDVPFNSVSAAAVAVLGRSANGKLEWRLEARPEISFGDWAAQTQGGPEQPTDEIESVQSSWQPFFHALAVKVLDYQQRQPELVQVLKDAGVAINHDEGQPLAEIDPFTFFSLILKHTSDATALPLLARVGAGLGLSLPAPTDLKGVPWSNPMNAWFFAYRSQRKDSDIPTLWALARQAVAGQLDAQTFREALEIRKVALPKLTQGLFWLNPGAFLALNSVNVPFLQWHGVKTAGKVQTLAEYQEVLRAAQALAPDFLSLSHAAWLRGPTSNKVATLRDGRFPFTEYRQDVQGLVGDKVKGNMLLEQRYSPLLVELFREAEPEHLTPSQSAYGGGQQLAVKVSLGGGVKMSSGVFGRALLFADDSGFEYVRFPAGLTLEIGIPDGKGDGPRQALERESVRQDLLDAMVKSLPLSTPPTLTLNTDFGPLQLLPLTPEGRQVASDALSTYAAGTGKSRRLRVGISLLPAELESQQFTQLLEAAVNYADELKAALEPIAQTPERPSLDDLGKDDEEELAPSVDARIPLNQILYGPPGTGKTYNVVTKALVILDAGFMAGQPDRPAMKARYDELVAQGAISFVTFHQSFGYEDFVEGIKPVMQGGQLSYVLEDGIFLEAVRAAGGALHRMGEQTAPAARESALAQTPQPEPSPLLSPNAQVWRIYIDGGAPISQLRDKVLARGEMRVGHFGMSPRDWNTVSADELHSTAALFRDGVRVGDLLLLASGVDTVAAVGIVTGEYTYDPTTDPMLSLEYVHGRAVNWLQTGLRVDARELTGKRFSPVTLQRVKDVSAETVLQRLGIAPLPFKSPTASEPDPVQTEEAAPPRRHVLIIDEINRGNVAKIFGELITLLETGKRAGRAEALTVKLPLSRRALSVPDTLYVVGTMNTADRSLTQLDTALRRRFTFQPVWPEPEVLRELTIDGITLDLRKFLYAINERIERLLSREQMIGHAYLLDIPGDLPGVAGALRERILPQLEEYFFDDWGKIREVLDDPHKEEHLQFVQERKIGGEKRHRINEAAFGELEAFRLVYSRLSDDTFPFEA